MNTPPAPVSRGLRGIVVTAALGVLVSIIVGRAVGLPGPMIVLLVLVAPNGLVVVLAGVRHFTATGADRLDHRRIPYPADQVSPETRPARTGRVGR